MILGASATTCAAGVSGAMRYVSATGNVQVCDGSAWKSMFASTCDSAPSFFAFTDQSALAPSTLVSSNIVLVTGMDAGCSVTVGISGTGGSPEYRVCSTSNCSSVDINWTTANNNLAMQGKYLQLRATTSASAGTTFTITANVGPGSSNWNILTAYADCSANPVGTVCGDGTVYAGTSPDGSTPMYVTRCDVGQSWSGSCTGSRAVTSYNDGAGNFVNAPLADCSSVGACTSSGESDTSILINVDSNSVTAGSQVHAAAQYCADLSSNGYTDWYLPSASELNVMYAGRTAIGQFDVASGSYQSSSEYGSNDAWFHNFNNGAQTSYAKNAAARFVRCARRNADVTPASLSFTDQTNQAAGALVNSNILQITGMDTATSVAIINQSADGSGNPQYRICSDSSCSSVVTGWNSSVNVLSNNQYVQLRMNANGAASALNRALVIVGDSTDQWDLTTSSSDPCAGSPSPGAICTNGSVYAGLSPDGNVAMYVTRCDVGQSWSGSTCTGSRLGKAWNDGNTNFVDTLLVNAGSPGAADPSGSSNTAILINVDSNSVTAGTQVHTAAQHCADLSENGQTDWYLPSAPELNVMYTNNSAIGRFDIGGGIYWSSSESGSASYVWYHRFSDGLQSIGYDKTTGYNVRCARRNADVTPASLSFTDQTNQAAGALVNSNILQITGINTATSVAIINKSADGSGNPQYRICSDSSCSSVVTGWNSAISALSNNQYVQLRMYANGAASALNRALVIVGDSTDQWDLTTSSSDPCAGSPNPGAVCTDGSVYAGLSPDGNVAMYVTRCDVGQSWSGSACTGSRVGKTYNDGDGNWVNTALVDCATAPVCAASGETNTTTLIAADSNSVLGGTQMHVAAQHCADLSENGQTDWYLPSAPELNVIHTNKSAIGQFDTSGSFYASSSEIVAHYGWIQDFNDASQWPGYKNVTRWVRCTRR